MRLNQIKLSGFKSFAEPTTFQLPGQRVGVVGPNGCGKSNIMDAVRWVLGESKASELRGESMQDVIFNGTNTRKPASRSSVELIFDNADHRAGGQWAQFAGLALAEHPAHGVHDVGLAAAIGAHHAHELPGQQEVGGFGKGLEPGKLDRCETHGPSPLTQCNRQRRREAARPASRSAHCRRLGGT